MITKFVIYNLLETENKQFRHYSKIKQWFFSFLLHLVFALEKSSLAAILTIAQFGDAKLVQRSLPGADPQKTHLGLFSV